PRLALDAGTRTVRKSDISTHSGTGGCVAARIMDMSASTAQPMGNAFEMPAWKSTVSHVTAALTAIIFLTAGIWKATHPFLFAQLEEQLLVPYQLSLPGAVLLAFAET